MSLVLDLLIVVPWLCGMFALGRLAYVRSTPWRHKVVNHPATRQAVTLSATDRFIRDQEHELWPDKEFNHVQCAVCGPGPLMQGVVPSRYGHSFFNKTTENHFDGYGSSWKVEKLKGSLAEYATIVSSAVVESGKPTGMHTLMLDLDYSVAVIESTTTGHHHLYGDHLMTWRQYRRVLKAMAEAGLIEQEYYRAAVRQSATMLRPPWVKKPAVDPDQVNWVMKTNRDAARRALRRWKGGNG